MRVAVGTKVLRAAVAAALIVLAAMPAAASAGTRSQTITISGFGSVASVSATCPSGQRASGGGFSLLRSAATTLIPLESRKVGQRSWRVSARLNGFDPLSATAFAYCSADAPRTKEKSTTIAFPGSSIIHLADAGCGGAGKAMAGGFSSVGPPGFSPLEFYRADKKTWRTRAWNDGGPPVTLTSYVYCADEAKPAARTGSAISTGPTITHTALSAECKRGTKPVAGGFSQPGGSISAGFFDPFYSSFRTGKRWQASASHNDAASTTLNSIAYCA